MEALKCDWWTMVNVWRRWIGWVLTIVINFLEEQVYKIIRCAIGDDRCTTVCIPELGENLLKFLRVSPDLRWLYAAIVSLHSFENLVHGPRITNPDFSVIGVLWFLRPLPEHSDSTTLCSALTVDPWWCEVIMNRNSSFRTMFVNEFRELCVA